MPAAEPRPAWWYTSASPETILKQSIQAPDTPGLEASSSVESPLEDNEPFLPEMTA